MTAGPTRTLPAARPLLLTADGALLDDLVRIAAEASVELDVARDPGTARTLFRSAPLVLVGTDLAAACARARLPHRGDVVLVGRVDDPAGPPLWPAAESLRARHVAVLPAAEPWLAGRLAQHQDGGDRPLGRLIAVLGGRGGAGASVLAAGLAMTASRRGASALLVDADPLGGGLDLLLGWESVDGLRWPALAHTSGRISPHALVGALPGDGRLVVLSFDREHAPGVPVEAMAATLDAARRSGALVVVDLPRRLDDGSLLALAAADRGYLVVPAELRACAAGARIAALAVRHCPALSVVVRGPAPGGLTSAEVCRALGLPLAGYLRPETGLARALERGEAPARAGRGPLAVLCQRLLDEGDTVLSGSGTNR